MQFSELVEMNHAIFRKMRDFYKSGRFGFPISLGIHIGRGMEAYSYQAMPVGPGPTGDHMKAVFLAGVRAGMEHHNADWSVVTMDAFRNECKPGVDAEMYHKIGTDLLIKAGLVRRVPVMSQFAQTRDGKIHALSAEQTDEKTFGPVKEMTDYQKITGNMLLFQPPSPMIREIMERKRAELAFVGAMMPFHSFDED